MNYVQIGIQTTRGPKGEMLNSVPIYVTEEDFERTIKKNVEETGDPLEKFGNYIAQKIKNNKLS